MKTTAADLLLPYADYLARSRDLEWQRDDRETVGVALLRAEAAHVAEVRNAQGEPVGGWKNELPLEHVTPLGHFIQSRRTGNTECLDRCAKSHHDGEVREQCELLRNADCVLIEFEHRREKMTTDQLIGYIKDAMLDEFGSVF